MVHRAIMHGSGADDLTDGADHPVTFHIMPLDDDVVLGKRITVGVKVGRALHFRTVVNFYT